MPPMYKYKVWLRRADEPNSPVESVEIDAYTRHTAARSAEAGNPGFSALAVAAKWEITGRCGKCRSVIFSDERSRKGTARCVDCG